jgi:hypothetical protein
VSDRPVLRATLPRGWRAFAAPGVDVVARPPHDTGGFGASVVLSRCAAPSVVPLAWCAAQLRPPAGAATLGTGVHRDGGFARHLRLVLLDGPGEIEVAQVQALVGAEGTSQRHGEAVVFIGTCAFDELDRYGDVFGAVVAGISLD